MTPARMLGVVLTGWLLCAPALAQSPIVGGKAHLVSGSLEHNGQAHTASAEGARLSLDGGSEIFVAPGSVLRFHGTIKLHLSNKGPRTRGHVVELERGRIDVSVPLSSPPKTAVLVQLPRDASSITKGGRSTTLIEGDRVTTAAREGEMLTGSDNKWRTLRPGFAKAVSTAVPHGELRPVPAKPARPNIKQRMLLQSSEHSATVSAQWPASARARSYDARLIARAAAGKTYQKRSRTPRVSFDAVEPGLYDLAVRVIDDWGVESDFSVPETVRVLGLDLPAGAAFSRQNTIFLPPARGVALLGAQGLQISYGGLERFISVPERLSLAGERGISVVLRDPESKLRMSFRLEPLVIDARIIFARNHDRWPEAGFPVEIRLSASGRVPLPRTVAVTTKVTVNLDTIQPSWHRSGDRLRATIPRPRGDGPWVVRVEVVDEFGNAVGRDVIEIGT